MHIKDMTGHRHGMIAVLRQTVSDRHGRACWLCRCDCGKEIVIPGTVLVRGRRISCGCVAIRPHNWTHGITETRTHRIWAGMIQRCTNPKTKHFRHYGARGITVCERWNDFMNFLADMGRCPDGHSIERKDNDLGYSPENCCWLPVEKQQQNRRGNTYVEIDGEKLCVEEAARRLGIKGPTLRYRLQKSVSKPALDAPVLPGKTKLVTFNGETLSMKQWAERLGIGRAALSMRFKYGWSIERALGESR